ncbi:hypothetical protein [Hydromonas duriensis]|uniref:Uncharacterized protein n=1 Tax=Hydromonas duriensis TaxID=1527608 RepID=A0A4R6Y7J1_9BURK|nr:hypothetical protein [Hydromonas duriensis]TDR31302.1 hypothetical protein DFR44_11166 [Hydromonas duriensis]
MSTVNTPKRWKSMLVTFAVVFPTVELLNRGILPLLGDIPFLLHDVLAVASMCIVLTFALPWAMRLTHRWLVS